MCTIFRAQADVFFCDAVVCLYTLVGLVLILCPQVIVNGGCVVCRLAEIVPRCAGVVIAAESMVRFCCTIDRQLRMRRMMTFHCLHMLMFLSRNAVGMRMGKRTSMFEEELILVSTLVQFIIVSSSIFTMHHLLTL